MNTKLLEEYFMYLENIAQMNLRNFVPMSYVIWKFKTGGMIFTPNDFEYSPYPYSVWKQKRLKMVSNTKMFK